MSGLCDDPIGGLDEATSRGQQLGGRPMQDQAAPGLAALPPDPRAIAAGLAAIRARDPAFDEGILLAQAGQVWHRTTGAVEPPRDATISAATLGPTLASVTVRFGTAAGEEDWVFERSASAATPASPDADRGRCPNCGAPLQLDAAGTCPYCRATVPAAPGWTLAARNRLRPMTADDAAALAAVALSAAPVAAQTPAPPPAPAATQSVDLSPLGVDAYDLLATARDIAYTVAQARSQRRPDLAAGRVTGDLARALGAEATAMAGEHRHHVLSFLEVDRAEILAAVHELGGDSVTVRMQMTGEEYELADGSLEVVEGSRTPRSWSEDWVLTRAAGEADWMASATRRVDPVPAAVRPEV